MKNMTTKILILIGVGLLSACSSQSPLEVGVQSSVSYMVPSSRRSCKLIKKDGTTDPSDDDVTASYFQFDRVNFKWSDKGANVKIQKVVFNFEDPLLPGGKINCPIAGEDLYASNDVWYPNGEAIVGVRTVKNVDDSIRYTPSYIVALDCPFTCGGFDVGSTSFSVSGTLEIIAVKVDDYGASLNEPQVRVSTAVTIAN
jgi:hypothetical protein